MKTEILELLKNTDGFLSGQELCAHFQVSRTAVWKVIRRLQEEGYEIEAVNRKGYRLLKVADVMTESEVKSRMKTSWAGVNYVYYDETDSTNTRIKQLAEEGAPHGTLAVADAQTGGRGRRGRAWCSPKGSSVYMSICLRPSISPANASGMTLVMALAVALAVEKVTGLAAVIKWPNDVVVNRKKICGILTEMSAEIDYIHYVVIGTGINVNAEEFPEEIRSMATSLRIELGKPVSRAAVIAAVMEEFECLYEHYIENENLSWMKEAYEAHLANLGKEVSVLDPRGTYAGVAEGINESGELLVRKADGALVSVYAGEVSVRGIYGYV